MLYLKGTQQVFRALRGNLLRRILPKTEAAIEREYSQLAVAVMEIEHMTGKEAIELVRAKTSE